MSKQTGNMVRLGIFVTLGIFLFVMGIYYLGNSKNLFGNTFSLYADFKNVSGLQAGNNVRFSGINIGSIKQINILNDSTLRVEMTIEEKVKDFIKKDALASISTDGLVGSALINIMPGSSASQAVDYEDVLQSYSKVKIDDILQVLGKTTENIASVSLNLLEVTDKINSNEGTLGSLIRDSDIATDIKSAAKSIKKTGTNLVDMTTELNQHIANLQEGEGLLGYLLTDDSLIPKIEGIFSKVDTIIETQAEPAFTDLQETAKELNAFSQELKKITADINAGKGLVGTLLKDETSDQQIQEILQNVNESSLKINESMEALKQSWLFRAYFRKQEKNKKGIKETETLF